MKYFLFCICLMNIIFLPLYSQVKFSENTDLIFPNTLRSGVAVGVADMDGDYYDDIVTYHQGVEPTILFYRGIDRPYEILALDYSDNFGKVWSTAIGDVDGDDDLDIICAYSSAVILYRQMSAINFEPSIIRNIEFLPQSANLVDIDMDGDLDYFLCNDAGPSRTMFNNGLGQFQDKDYIDFSTLPSSDGSGNYSSVWFDIDNDNDKDLFIAKCSAGVSDPVDPRRINMLYINEGLEFSSRAQDFKLSDGAQSWSVDAGDVDNDGDIDLLITNHDGPHKLMINNNDHFSNFPFLQYKISSYAIQGVFYDIDNNGWLDIIYTDGKYNFILYNFNMNFELSDPLGSIQSKPNSAIVADVNNDGFGDLVGQYHGGTYTGTQNNPIRDKVWINQGNANNYIDIVSNILIDKAILYCKNLTQKRETLLGRSYGQQMSTKVHFGLGNINEIDSLVIIWNDREKRVITGNELIINNINIIQRDLCITTPRKIGYSSLILCEEDSLLLYTHDGNEVLWNTGEITDTLVVTKSGTYNYKSADPSDLCLYFSDYINITNKSAENSIETIRTFGCQDNYIVLSPEGSSTSYLWNTGDTTDFIEVNTSGSFSCTLTNECSINYYYNYLVELADKPSNIDIVKDTTIYGSSITLESDQESTYWYHHIDDIEPFYRGKILTFDTLTMDKTLFAAHVKENIGQTTVFKPVEFPSNNQYHNTNLNGGIYFVANQDCYLHSIDVETDTAGYRSIIIANDFDTIYNKKIFVEKGKNTLDISTELPKQVTLLLTTDKEVNKESFGYVSPRFTRIQNDTINYPYSLDQIVEILGSTNGDSRYFYFFNLKISHDLYPCESERQSVNIRVKGVNTLDINQGSKIFPNPANGRIYIPNNIRAIHFFDIHGNRVKSSRLIVNNLVSTQDLVPGLYVVQLVYGDSKIEYQKISVIK